MRQNLNAQLAGGLPRTNIAPPGHEELEPQDLSTLLKLLIKEALKHRGIKLPVNGLRAGKNRCIK